MSEDNIIIRLDTLETEILVRILNETISKQTIPDITNGNIKKEQLPELDSALINILKNLKERLDKEKIAQLEQTEEDGNQFIVRLNDTEIFDLENGTYSDVEPIIENILEQVEQQRQ